LTETKRGYAGFNSKHPAKSEFKRLTMVWDHASDMGQNKPHKCHKPEPLAKTQIEMCTNPGDLVLDLFAGSGQIAITARDLGRPFVSVERDPEVFDALVERLRE
jgi:DNA modification methylase